jgi:hypothetical protein
MTDHKFTDDDVIKALECCKRPANQTSCDDCPYQFSNEKCSSKLIDDALALINRQKAEIEKLGRDRYQLLPDGRVELIPRTDINAIKAEAIKEFAQRLKSDLGRIPQHQFTRSQIEWSINTFVKEMTEEQTNESQST